MDCCWLLRHPERCRTVAAVGDPAAAAAAAALDAWPHSRACLRWACRLTAVHPAALSSAAKLGIDYTGVPHLLVKSSVSLTAAPKVRQGVCWRSPSGSYTTPI